MFYFLIFSDKLNLLQATCSIAPLLQKLEYFFQSSGAKLFLTKFTPIYPHFLKFLTEIMPKVGLITPQKSFLTLAASQTASRKPLLKGERLSTVHLLIKITCFVKQKNTVFSYKSI